jgi:hypothetical protein
MATRSEQWRRLFEKVATADAYPHTIISPRDCKRDIDSYWAHFKGYVKKLFDESEEFASVPQLVICDYGDEQRLR